MNPKISIIVPIYNTEKYLQTCLESIINQSLKEIEIICIVNGCTDNSLGIVRACMRNDSRIRLIVKEQADVGAARNAGVRAATGEYLMFVDSDDWITLDACARLYSTAKEHDLDILQGRYRHVPRLVLGQFKCRKSEFAKKQPGIDFWMNNCNISVVNWDKIWRRSFFIDKELYNPEGVYFEDNMTAVRGMVFTEAFMVIDFVFYFYRCSPDSIMNKPTTEKHIESSFIKIQHLRSFLRQYRLEKHHYILLFYIRNIFVHHADYNKHDSESLLKFFKEIDIRNLRFFPFKIILAYLLPRTALRVYPVWRRRKLFKHILLENYWRFSRRTGGRVFCRREF